MDRGHEGDTLLENTKYITYEEFEYMLSIGIILKANYKKSYRKEARRAIRLNIRNTKYPMFNVTASDRYLIANVRFKLIHLMWKNLLYTSSSIYIMDQPEKIWKLPKL